MALRINTNVAALAAHKNMINNDNALSSSLEKLSSGLRINRAADDASGMAIADSLKSQALGIGQAIRNANDGISIVQTADGALDESIKIVNTIKTKAIQSAQDGQTTESRKAIQADITRLMEELDLIARSTAFNNQKLLSGNFTDKKFQVGAYSGETVNISIGSSESTKIGHVTTGQLELTNTSGGEVQLSIYSNINNQAFTVQAVDLRYNNNTENGLGALANAINKLSDVLGVSADAVVESYSNAAVSSGTTASDFAINGVDIGQVIVQNNDSDGALVKAINNKTADHGLVASVDAAGILKLTANDGRAISVTGGTGDVLTGSNLSTFGHVVLNQYGANELIVNDLSSGSVVAFNTAMSANGDITTTKDSKLTAGSILVANSTMEAGSTIGVDLTNANIGGNITATGESKILAGSSLAATSTLEQGTVLGGIADLENSETTTTDSLLKAGSLLHSGTVLKAGTLITSDITDGATTITSGSVLAADTTIDTNNVISSDMVARAGSVLFSGTLAAAGSYVGADIVLNANMNLTADMTILAGNSVIADAAGTNLRAGSTIGGDIGIAASATMTQDMILKSGSVIESGSSFATNSTLGGEVVSTTSLTAQADITLAAGSVLFSGTRLESGTVLTNDIVVSGAAGSGVFTIAAGTTLEQDYVLAKTLNVSNDMTLKADSVLFSGSTFAANTGGASGTRVVNTEMNRLADVSVLDQAGAQIAIAVADSALKDLDKVRSDLGSVQNQLTSTIANLSVTRVNIFAAESSIRDVDFAEEAATFSKMQILSQASSFAMAQANASSQNVLSLLQG